LLIGYARTSTSNQKYSLENQIEKLTSKGCEKIFSEEISSVSSNRPEFEKSLEFAREGDTLVVTTLSRFARSISDLWKNVERLDAKGVSFQILDMNLDTSTPTGKLLLTMLGAVYQFEREILLERQLVGIAKAKREGKFKGRVPTAKRKSGDIQRLLQEGLKPKQIAEKLGVGVASVYRYRCLSD
jgi:DNA invertase Pin-like site-specific DNA recombinase